MSDRVTKGSILVVGALVLAGCQDAPSKPDSTKADDEAASRATPAGPAAPVELADVTEQVELWLAQPGGDDRVVLLEESPAIDAKLDAMKMEKDRLYCWEELGYVRCQFPDGTEGTVGPVIDAEDARTSQGSCYAACGSACRGGCLQIPIGCEPAGPSGLSPARPCLAWKNLDRVPPRRRPVVQGGKVSHVVPLEHFETRRFDPCGDALIYGRLTRLEGAALSSCTTADCCARHDECTRQDSGGAWLRCHLRGLKLCGVGALDGRPRQAWDLKWFDLNGWAVSDAGSCRWESGRPVEWIPPARTPFPREQAECLIHDLRHPRGGGYWPLEAEGLAGSSPAPVALPTSLPAPR